MPDENPPNPTDPPPSANPPSKFPEFKEVVTALIALAIVTTLIVFLWDAFFYKYKDLTEIQKYIIGIAISLAGTVTGYYFGRVPAEKHADTAQRAADTAQEAKVKADAKVEDVKKTLDRLLPGPPGAPALDAMRAEAMPASDPLRDLAALRRRL
jgi:hypothetical protein